MAKCPNCDVDVETREIQRGEVLGCPGCGAELEVIGTEPLELALAPEIEEDWGE